jgi:hypothetical protein
LFISVYRAGAHRMRGQRLPLARVDRIMAGFLHQDQEAE